MYVCIQVCFNLLPADIEEVLEKTRKELKDVREELVAWQCQCTSAIGKLEQQKDLNSVMRREICRLEKEQERAEKVAEETSKLRRRLKELKKCVVYKEKYLIGFFSIEDMLEGSESEVEDMVKDYRDSATELAKFLVVLKQLSVHLSGKSLFNFSTLQKLREPQG